MRGVAPVAGRVAIGTGGGGEGGGGIMGVVRKRADKRLELGGKSAWDVEPGIR